MMNHIVADKIRECLECATLAPSIDNCQPWIFTLSDNVVDIRLDRQRAEFFGDYEFTGSFVTMGAVVENIVIAAANSHMQVEVEFLPEGETFDPIVSITFRSGSENRHVAKSLYGSIKSRCTNRRPYRQDKLSVSTLQSLHALVDDKARLLLFDDHDLIKNLSEISETVDQVIFEHKLLHENLFRWMRWTDKDTLDSQDGMGINTLELNFADRCAFRLISFWPLLRLFNLFGVSRLIAKTNSGLIRKSAAVGLLVVEGSSDKDYFRGGRLLERFWLQAAAEGVSFQPYGAMPFLLTRIKRAGHVGFGKKHYQMLQGVKERLAGLAGINDDQTLIMMFRLGYANAPSDRTIRRPLTEVLAVKKIKK